MTDIKHTPGPWKLLAVGDNGRLCPADRKNHSLLTLEGEDGTTFAAVYEEADAHLIAAAPDLFDLMSRANEADSSDDDIRTAWWDARAAAIAKAEGRSTE